jgi:hypothetical protein
MKTLRKTVFLIAAMAAATAGAIAADAPKPSAPKAEASSTDLQQLIDQFKSRRDALLADRQALLNQLKTATAAQREAILEKMQAQQKDLIEAQRALGRQIRDEMRKLRDTTAPAGH